MSASCGVFASDTILISKLNFDNDLDINVITPMVMNDVINFGDINGPELNLTIYNRWGQEIFSESQRSIKWNALFKNEPLVSGTYFWVLEYKSECAMK
ncbi:MAG: gliding motility-associated C-terminal domain-containing protein [Bacteroidetes bacterium]|nr:gliding motility-associated C-terminal domain-containing protein [Bacteroidota bacterium]